MKTAGLEEKYSSPGLLAGSIKNMDISMEDIIRKGIVSFQASLCWDGKQLPPGDRNDKKLWREDNALSLRNDDGITETYQGFIYYSSNSELTSFIMEHLDLEGPGMLSGYIGRIARRYGTLTPSAIEEALSLKTGRHTVFLSGAGFSRRELPVAEIDNWSDDFHLTEGVSGRMWHRCSDWHDQKEQIFLGHFLQEICGYSVPRVRYIKPVNGYLPDSEEISDLSWLYFDSNRHGWSRSLEAIPENLRDSLDRSGTLLNSLNLDVLPTEHLICRGIVRIPPREEFAECQKNFSGKTAPHKFLENPSFVLDSRYPVRIPEDAEIISCPEAAVWLMARTVNSIYIPGHHPAPYPERSISEQERFIMLLSIGAIC